MTLYNNYFDSQSPLIIITYFETVRPYSRLGFHLPDERAASGAPAGCQHGYRLSGGLLRVDPLLRQGQKGVSMLRIQVYVNFVFYRICNF